MRKACLIAVVCLVAAACSAQSPAGPSPTGLTPETTRPTGPPIASPSPTALTPETTRPTAPPTLDARFEPTASAPPDAIALQLGTCCRVRFVPDTLTVQAGTVALFLTNFPNVEFPLSHDIHIGTKQGQAITSSPVLKNGETGLFTIEDMAAGDYVFWCLVDQHNTFGMVGTLTVTP